MKSISKLSALKRKRTFITETEHKLNNAGSSNKLGVSNKQMQKTVSIAVDTETSSGLDTLLTNPLSKEMGAQEAEDKRSGFGIKDIGICGDWGWPFWKMAFLRLI